MILIIGGSASGKSAFAEQTAIARGRGMPLYYLATMQIYDAEGEAKVERHRRLRAGKGFATIEQPREIAESLNEMTEPGTVLLECMSNLVANEMFGEEKQKSADAVADKVVTEILALCQGTRELIVVTNNVFEDGIRYDASTMEYLRALGAVNCRLAETAETVAEVIAGIPVVRKGAL
ncbi:MAG: bifunctional adenosylcobinamide kinase/adenosylcobinamide-phosphate guanylyltransferase [Roseburia sp.]|nr:bifunctional adenosylcobinamide kinase/adenosylcobinamide-phosphate guanylyltransferase [Roseburia sp.]